MNLQNEKLLKQLDFLNKENHRLGAIDYFHNHRCRQEEVNRLDAQIATLTKENEKLKKALDKYNINLNENSMMTSNTSFMKLNRTFRTTKSKLNTSIAPGSGGSEVKKLKQDKKDLEKLLEDEKGKVQSLMKEKDEIQTNLEKKTKEFDDLKKENEALKGAGTISMGTVETFGQALNSPKKETVESDKDKPKSSDNKGEELKEINEKLLQENEKMKSQLKEKEKEILDHITSNQQTNQNCDLLVENMKKEIKGLNAQIAELNEEKNKLLEQLTKKSVNSSTIFNEENANLKFDLKKREIEIEHLKSDIQKLNDEKTIITNENTNLHKEVEKLRNEILSLTTSANGIKSANEGKIKEYEEEIEKLKAQNETIQKKLDEMKIEKERAENEYNTLRSELSKAQPQKEEENEMKINEEINKLRKEKSDAEDQHKVELEERNKQIEELIKEMEKVKTDNTKLIEDISKIAKENEALNALKKDEIVNTSSNGSINLNSSKWMKEKEKLTKNLELFASENKAAAQHIKTLENSLNNLQKVNIQLINELSVYKPKSYEGSHNESID